MTAFLLISACSGGGGGSSPPPVLKISIAPSPSPGVNMTAQGDPVPFSATLTSDGVPVEGATFSWQSDDTSIVTVDSSTGLAQGEKIGLATISVSSGSTTASVRVGVIGKSKGSASLSLIGIASYEDRPFDENGFTAGTLPTKPIRNAVIEAVAIEGFQKIGSGITDPTTGGFSLTVDNSLNQAGVYLRVLSQTDPDPSSKTKVEVKNNKVSNSRFAFISPGLDDSSLATFSQNMLATASTIGGAFNLLDVLSDASEFVQNNVDCMTLSGCIPPLVTVFWEPGSDEGTFYDDATASIHVLGGGTPDGDTDEYDDAVVIHEYGHFILNQLSQDNSPGGEHFLSENDQDIRLSWSEGWANFFALAVLGDPVYVDTFPGGTLISFNLEDLSSSKFSALKSVAIYTTNELAVASVLWDAFDGLPTPPKDPEDVLSGLTFGDIWQTILSFPDAQPTTMETFWLQFKSGSQTSGFTGAFQAVLKGREIELFPDTTEASEMTLAQGTPQHHTLYGSGTDPTGDTDDIPFTVAPNKLYTVKTFNLTNGADTFLQITASNGFMSLGENDDPPCFSGDPVDCLRNNQTNLSSTVIFNSGTNTSLSARISGSPNAPPSAGLFGSYEISLTSP